MWVVGVEGKGESYSMPKCAWPEGNWIGGCSGGQVLCGRVPVCEVGGGGGRVVNGRAGNCITLLETSNWIIGLSLTQTSSSFCSVSSLSHAAGASSIELTGCGTYLCASVHSVLVGRGRDGGMTHSGEPPRHRPCAEGRKEGDKVMKRLLLQLCAHTDTPA